VLREPMERVAAVRVTFADTDAMGVAYYANYLKWLEIGRTELMRRMGIAYAALTKTGVHLPVTEVRVRYMAPARYDDLLHVHAAIGEIGRARITFSYRIDREDGRTLTEGHTVHAFTDGQGRIVPVPSELAGRLRAISETGQNTGPGRA
jgi:acyl-CoA thioester hydrolase